MWTCSTRQTLPLTLLVLSIASCSGAANDGVRAAPTQATESTQPAPTTSVTTTATTVAPTTTTTMAPADFGETIIRDIVYLEMDGHEYLVDVYVPGGDGPWPVVVALHGGTVYKGHNTNTVVAWAAAEAGMLVFAPNWVAEWPALSAMDAEFLRSGDPVLPCALAFAQQEAAAYGGDPDRTVVYGQSGGATVGARLVLGPARDLTSGCLAQTSPIVPVGAVFGDAEYFNHAKWWDGAFDKDITEMQRIIAETVDPDFWTADLPARIRLWAAADGSFQRTFYDPWDEDGWFAQRDPDGTIRQDLDELGELDDGVITYIDEGLLLATRLQQADVDATFDIFPGGHTTLDKVPELVAYLLEVSGSS